MSEPPIEETASWFARHRLGPLSDEEASAFRNWLRASPEHAREWSRQAELWVGLESVRDVPRLMALREAARAQAGQVRLRRIATGWGAGLAACGLLASFAWRVPAPDAVRADAASALLVPLGGELRALPLVRDVSTRVGERALVELADGSKVTLNTDSALHADFTGGERRVGLLRGEAYFEVAKDPEHPFVVSAGDRQVTAVGTAFGIRLQPQQVKVDLVQGRVRVTRRTPGAAAPVELAAGSSLVARPDHEDLIAPFNADHDIAWRSGRLVFQSERLADVVAEVNRYSVQKLALRDPSIADRLVSGVFEPSDAGKLAGVLEGYGIVRIVGRTHSEIMLAAP